MAADATGIREYKGAAKSTTITAGITNVATSWSIADSTGWPTGAVGNFIITLDRGTSLEEKVLCSGLAGGVLTVAASGRGYDNTTAVAHGAGASIDHSISAIDIAEANYIANTHNQASKATPVAADEIPLFDSAATFGLKKLTLTNLAAWLASLVQTLTNKTLTAPKTQGGGITMSGVTSGTVVFDAPSVGSNGTIKLPDTATTETLVGKATTDTLTNKDISSSTNKFPAGTVIQTVSATYATATNNATSTYADTGLTATITPKLSTSKILVIVDQNGVQKDGGNSANGTNLILLRGATTLAQFAILLGYTGSTLVTIAAGSMNYLDSPATTSATTYKTQFANNFNGGTVTVQANNVMSSITLMEIAQ